MYNFLQLVCKATISVGEGVFPVAMLVKELKEGVLEGRNWIFYDSVAYQIDEVEAEAFDKDFEPYNKEYRTSQELFYVYSHSQITG